MLNGPSKPSGGSTRDKPQLHMVSCHLGMYSIASCMSQHPAAGCSAVIFCALAVQPSEGSTGCGASRGRQSSVHTTHLGASNMLDKPRCLQPGSSLSGSTQGLGAVLTPSHLAVRGQHRARLAAPPALMHELGAGLGPADISQMSIMLGGAGHQPEDQLDCTPLTVTCLHGLVLQSMPASRLGLSAQEAHSCRNRALSAGRPWKRSAGRPRRTNRAASQGAGPSSSPARPQFWALPPPAPSSASPSRSGKLRWTVMLPWLRASGRRLGLSAGSEGLLLDCRST